MPYGTMSVIRDFIRFFSRLRSPFGTLIFLAQALLYMDMSLAISRGSQENHPSELDMANTLGNMKSKTQISIMDALLYLLTGSAMVIISVSFLLWLRF